ncbi:MAG: ATP-binding protein [Candidatus Helarchaeota archaeon]
MVQLKTNLCSICKKKRAVFYQKHSGLYLCRKDFIENFERRIRRTIHKYNMFREDDVIAVGVSGGKDSLTLLYILNKFEKRFPKSKLIAIMIDEGIKGYREEGVKLTKKLTEELGIPLKIFSYKELYGYSLDEIVEILDKKKFDVAAPCSYCGVLRRRALNYGAILRSDIDRIGRSGPITRKLEGIFVRRVKPMRTIPEREVVLYAYYNKIPFHSVGNAHMRHEPLDGI